MVRSDICSVRHGAKGRRSKPRAHRQASKAGVLQAARDYKRANAIPLLVHSTLRWARKIRGKLVYFGKVDADAADFGASAAVALYNQQREDLEAGRIPRENRNGLPIRDLLNGFLESKEAQRDRGELSPRTFRDV